MEYIKCMLLHVTFYITLVYTSKYQKYLTSTIASSGTHNTLYANQLCMVAGIWFCTHLE